MQLAPMYLCQPLLKCTRRETDGALAGCRLFLLQYSDRALQSCYYKYVYTQHCIMYMCLISLALSQAVTGEVKHAGEVCALEHGNVCVVHT